MSEPIVLKITFIPVAPYKNRITGNRVRVSLDYWESSFFFQGVAVRGVGGGGTYGQYCDTDKPGLSHQRVFCISEVEHCTARFGVRSSVEVQLFELLHACDKRMLSTTMFHFNELHFDFCFLFRPESILFPHIHQSSRPDHHPSLQSRKSIQESI